MMPSIPSVLFFDGFQLSAASVSIDEFDAAEQAADHPHSVGVRLPYASSFSTTLPATSVRRKSRPWKR